MRGISSLSKTEGISGKDSLLLTHKVTAVPLSEVRLYSLEGPREEEGNPIFTSHRPPVRRKDILPSHLEDFPNSYVGEKGASN